MLHSLFYRGNCSTCFRWYHHPSSGAKTTVPTASGIYHTVTAICRYRGRVVPFTQLIGILSAIQHNRPKVIEF